MAKRLQTVGIVLALIGIGFLVAGGVAFAKVQDGYGSLQDFSAAQNVTLNYNDDGQLIDRGTTEGAAAIMDLLTEDWGYSVVESDLNPDDPVVNTASEYMFQMATIGYHILHGTQNVTLAEDVEYNGEVFAAGDYEVAVSEVGSPERLAAGYGGYWTDFDRQHPLEGPARSQAWSGTAHGLFGELGVGTTTHSTLQLGLGVAAIVAGIGFLALVTGFGMIWIARSKDSFEGIEMTSPQMAKKEAPVT
jgi:hypothetical protein